MAGEGVEVGAELGRRRPAAAAPPARRRPAPSRRRRVRAASDLGDRVDRARARSRRARPRPASRLPAASWASSSSRSSWPSLVDARRTRARAPFSSHSSCQGTTFEWCSISVISTDVAGSATFCRAQVKRTRLIASVALRTNTVSAGRRADEAGDRCPRALVELGRLGGELVHAAVDVRVRVAVVGVDRLDHATRASARSRRCRGRRAACRRPRAPAAGSRRGSPRRCGRAPVCAVSDLHLGRRCLAPCSSRTHS